MIDVRQGLPSASQLDRLIACPASFARERFLPEEESEVAERGTAIHAALQSGELNALTDHEHYVAMAALKIEESLREQLNFGSGVYGVMAEGERRMWLDTVGDKGVNFSGQFDKAYRHGSRLLLVDYKTGRREVACASENWQMAAYAVLAWVEAMESGEPLTEVYVAIIQPLVKPDHSLTRYTPKEIREAGREIVSTLRQVNDILGGAPAKGMPGEHCYYCRARGSCPEALSYATALVPIEQVKIETVGRKIEVTLPPMSPTSLREAYELCSTIERITGAVKDRFKESVAAGAQPDFEMRPGATRLELRNPVTVFKRLRHHVPLRRLLNAVKIGVDDTDEIVANALGISKGKAREFWVPLVADGLDAKEGAPQVRKKK